MARGHEHGAVVGVDVQRLANRNLLRIGALANVDLVAGRCGVNRVLDVTECGVGTLHLIVIYHQPGAMGRAKPDSPNERAPKLR